MKVGVTKKDINREHQIGIIPFGTKYKGKHVSVADTNYLKFILNNMTLYKPLEDVILEELDKRKAKIKCLGDFRIDYQDDVDCMACEFFDECKEAYLST